MDGHSLAVRLPALVSQAGQMDTSKSVWPGSPYPLGATWDGEGTNFAVYSESSSAVELCLFDDEGHEMRLPLPETDAFVWHGYVAGVGPGHRYGFRADGPYQPEHGHRFNPNK